MIEAHCKHFYIRANRCSSDIEVPHVHEAWLEQTAEEVLNIAENFAQLAVLFAIPAQGAAVSTGGGGGGGNNDLPKKRDDDWWKMVQAILQTSGGFKRKR